MRIVAGSYRSRKLLTPRGTATRPTSDRLRETLFNVLAPRLPGARFADLYAGSGAVGLEALSRGASFVCFAERAPAAIAAIRANLAALAVPSQAFALKAEAVDRVLSGREGLGGPCDLVFLDPPYDAAEEYSRTLSTLAERHRLLLAPGALVVAEHTRKRPLPKEAGALRVTRVLEQGDAALSFFTVAPEAQQPEAQRPEAQEKLQENGRAAGPGRSA